MDTLKDFILYYCDLPGPQLDQVMKKFSSRPIKKGRHLLKAGQLNNEQVYTVSGCFRHYHINKKNKDITTWIVLKNTLATELVSFLTQKPSTFNVEALEDSIIYSIPRKDLDALYKAIPEFQQFGRKIAEEIVVGAINRVVSHLNETAAQRYERLLKRSDYIHKIPLKYLASFLGITTTSLSRLRAKKK